MDTAITNKVLIREAGEEDVEAITKLMADLGYPTPFKEMQQKMRNIFAHPDYHTLLAVFNREIVGFSGLMKGLSFERSGNYVRIISFVVKKAQRNLGIGKLLIMESEAWAIEQGADSIIISSGNREERMAAHAFYQKAGYVIKSTGFFKSL